MIYYCVIDTNVLVSAMLKHGSIPFEIIQKALKGVIIPILNKEIIEEYEEVLLRNKFGFDKETVKEYIDGLIEFGVFCEKTNVDEIFSDLSDAVFYQIVMTVREYTDAYLITGNIKHFPKKPFVVTPKEMLEIIDKKSDLKKSSKTS